MATTEKKRKRAIIATEENFPPAVNLETLSDSGHDPSDSEEDDEDHSFPGLDTGPDSETEDEGETDATEQKESNNDSTGEDEKSSVFPKPKHVISSITGLPKRVYPPIEPVYDTDSSTEDVRVSL